MTQLRSHRMFTPAGLAGRGRARAIILASSRLWTGKEAGKTDPQEATV